MRVLAPLVVVSLILLTSGHSLAADASWLHIYGMEGRPISFLNENQADGMVVELAREVQRRIGSTDSIQIIPWARANALAASKQNVLLLSIVWTPERDRYLRFVGPVFYSHISAYAVRNRASALRKRDPSLRNLRAGARRGSVFASAARAGGYKLLDETNADENAAHMLMLGRFDLWFVGEEIVRSALESAGYHMEDVDAMLQLPPQPAYFAFSKSTPSAVVSAWEHGLLELKRDGTFQRIHNKWLPTYQAPVEVPVK